MKVYELMTENVETVMETDTVEVAATRMQDASCGALPVVGRDDEVLGIVTDRDICMTVAVQGRRPDDVTIDRAMRRRVVTCSRGDTAASALQVMHTHRLRRLPVVDDGGRLQGMISLDDLAFEVARGHILSGINAKKVLSVMGAFSHLGRLNDEDIPELPPT